MNKTFSPSTTTINQLIAMFNVCPASDGNTSVITMHQILTSGMQKGYLVDIYCDQDFSYLQGSEYERIAENAMTIFNINKTKLLRYANRRGVKEELEKIYNEL